MHNGLHITALIPARNEALALPFVIKSLQDVKDEDGAWVDTILVIDNASSDGTAQVSREYGASVITEYQTGYGAACWRGISSITETDIIIFVDGDFTYRSDDIKRVIQSLIHYELDMVMGSRFLGKIKPNSMTPWQIKGTQLICSIIKWRFNFYFSDLGSLRAIRMDKLKRLELQDRRFGWTAEMQIQALKNKLLILEVPVTSHPRMGKSKISGTFKGSVLASFDLLRTALWR